MIVRDFEAPIGVPLTYTAEHLERRRRGAHTTETATITIPSAGCEDTWLTDLVRAGNTQQVVLEHLEELAYPVPTSVHSIIGRRTPIISGDVAHTPSFELAFLTDTLDERDQARAALGNGVPVLLRTPPENGIGNLYMAVTGFAEQRIVSTGDRARPPVRGRRPSRSNGPTPTSTCPSAPITYAYVKTTFATYAILKAQRATYDALAYDWAGTDPSDIVPWPPDGSMRAGQRPVPGIAARGAPDRRALPALLPRRPRPGRRARRGRQRHDRPHRPGPPPRADPDPLVAGRGRSPPAWTCAPCRWAGTRSSSAACATPTGAPSTSLLGRLRIEVGELGDARPGRRARAGRPHGPGPRRTVHGPVRRRRAASGRRCDRDRHARSSAPRSATASRTTPPITLADVFYTGQRAEALTILEQAASAEIYFDADGDFVFASKEPGPSVWSVDAGEDGVMIDAGENLDRTGIYNGVLVEGQADADQPPVSALAVDDNPSSPTLLGRPVRQGRPDQPVLERAGRRPGPGGRREPAAPAA